MLPGSLDPLSVPIKMVSPMSEPVLYPFLDERHAGAEAATVLDGRYRVLAQLGVGGMGHCYKVLQLDLERECVLKILRPKHHPSLNALFDRPDWYDAAKLLEREAITLGQLSSVTRSSVVQVFGRGQVAVETEIEGELRQLDIPYYVMELLRGHNLAQIIDKTARSGAFLRLPLVIEIAYQAATTLAHAHRLGIIHRDIKPDNIYLERADDHSIAIRWIDFGISTREGEPSPPGTGTAHYGAPELLSRECTVETTKSDIYPLGLVIFELTALRGPFMADQEHIASAHMWQQAPKLSRFRDELPDALVELVDACLHKHSAERPSAAQVARSLHALRRPIEPETIQAMFNLASSMRTTRAPHVGSRGDPALRGKRTATASGVVMRSPSVQENPNVSEVYALAANGTPPPATEPPKAELPASSPFAEPAVAAVAAEPAVIVGQPVIIIDAPPASSSEESPFSFFEPPKPPLFDEDGNRVFRSTAEMFEFACAMDDAPVTSRPPPRRVTKRLFSERPGEPKPPPAVEAPAVEMTQPAAPEEPPPHSVATSASFVVAPDSTASRPSPTTRGRWIVAALALLTLFGGVFAAARLHGQRTHAADRLIVSSGFWSTPRTAKVPERAPKALPTPAAVSTATVASGPTTAASSVVASRPAASPAKPKPFPLQSDKPPRPAPESAADPDDDPIARLLIRDLGPVPGGMTSTRMKAR